MKQLALRVPSPSIINRAVTQRRTGLLKRKNYLWTLDFQTFQTAQLSFLSSGTQTLSK